MGIPFFSDAYPLMILGDRDGIEHREDSSIPHHLQARDGPEHSLQPGERLGDEEERCRVPVHDAVPEGGVELQGHHVVLEGDQIQGELAEGEVAQDAL